MSPPLVSGAAERTSGPRSPDSRLGVSALANVGGTWQGSVHPEVLVKQRPGALLPLMRGQDVERSASPVAHIRGTRSCGEAEHPHRLEPE